MCYPFAIWLYIYIYQYGNTYIVSTIYYDNKDIGTINNKNQYRLEILQLNNVR